MNDPQFDDPPIVEVIWGAIESHYPDFIGKTVLDIGCNRGYYSKLMAKKGAIVTAVDEKTFKTWGPKRGLVFIKGEIENVIDLLGDFDLILCLNVFHHMLRVNHDRAWETMHILSSKTMKMIFMIKMRKDGLAKRLWGADPERFLELFYEHTEFTHHEIILGNSIYKGRDLWVFW